MTTNTNEVTKITSVVRTSAGLRDTLFEEIDRIRRGDTDARTANAVARLASEIVKTVNMEIEVQKHLAAQPKKAEASPEPLNLMRPVALT